MYRNEVINALVYLLRNVVELRKPEHAFVIIKALPLYHFLCDLSVPNQQSHVSLAKITWGDSLSCLTTVQATLFDDKHG